MSNKPHDVVELSITVLAVPLSTSILGHAVDNGHLKLIEVDPVRLDRQSLGWRHHCIQEISIYQ